jgi:hypothetical protein
MPLRRALSERLDSTRKASRAATSSSAPHLLHICCVQFRHRTAASQPKRPDRVDWQILVPHNGPEAVNRHSIQRMVALSVFLVSSKCMLETIAQLSSWRRGNHFLSVVQYPRSMRCNNSCRYAPTSVPAPPQPRRVDHQH